MLTYRFILLILIAISFFISINAFPLFDLDEGAFSEATREMLSSGNYITTYLNGELRFDKPILIYWLQAVSVSIFGVNEIGFRLPSALASGFWAFAIYRFTKEFFNEEKALIAIIFFASAFIVIIMSKAATADALLNLWVTLSLFAVYRYIHNKTSAQLYLAFVFMALGVLTKGPVAVMIPLATSFLFLLIRGNSGLWLKSVFNPIGIVLFLLIASPWYIAEYLDQGQKFIDGFVLKHNIDRFSSSFEGHGGGYFYYVLALPILLAPFSGFFVNIFANIKVIIKDDLQLFLLIWFLFVLAFFSFSGTKLPHYIVYGLTPVFILAANYSGQLKNRFYLLLPGILVLLFFALLPNIFEIYKAQISDVYLISIQNIIPNIFNYSYQLMLLVASVALILCWYVFSNRFYQFLSSGLVFIMAVNFVITPTIASIEQLPIKHAAEFAKAQKISNIKMYRVNNPTFSVYTQSIVKNHPVEVGDIVLTKAHRLSDFKTYKILFQENGIYLAKIIEFKQ